MKNTIHVDGHEIVYSPRTNMSTIWIEKAEALKDKAKKQFVLTGRYDGRLVEKAVKMLDAAERVR